MEHTLTIRLDEGLAKALNDESRDTGVSKGQIAREALASRLGGKRKLQVMARYFGAVKGPKDLSSNKSYRRDWKNKHR